MTEATLSCPKRIGAICETPNACAGGCRYNNDPIHPNRIRARLLRVQGSFWYEVYRLGFVIGTGLRWRAFHQYSKARQRYEKMGSVSNDGH